MSIGYSQLFRKFILVLFLITQVIQTVASQNELKFTCDASGHIGTITKNNTDPAKILIKKTDTTYCHYSDSTCQTEYMNKTSSLHIIIQEETDPNLYAGKSNLHYSIECKHEFDVGATAIPFMVSPSSTHVVPLTVAPPVLSLKIMRKGSALQTNAEVYIGEKLQLEMSSMGNIVFPKSCIGMDGEHTTTTTPIWTYTVPSGNTVCSTHDSAITEDKWTLQKIDNKTLTIPIYAFQFTTSSKVIIKCSAHVCTLSHDLCSPISTNTCVNDVTARRKRRSLGVMEDAKTEEAYVSFSVKSEKKVQSKANALSVHFTLMVAVVVFGRGMVAFLRED